MNSKTIKGASLGISSGLFWAIDTILIGYILASATFMSFAEIALAAPLISTFLHDLMSSIWMMILLGVKGELGLTFKKLKTRSGLFVVLAATLGGPVGMTFYVLSVQSIGASFTATISSIYPAIGAFFAFILLKDKLSLKNWAGLLTSILSITLLSYSGNLISGSTVSIGLIFILLCVFGWGMESVIVAYGMKDDQVSPIQALLIRQFTSAVIFGLLIIPIFVGHSVTGQVLSTNATWLIALIALAGTLSYIFYYQAINLVGPVRAMGLNISYAAWAILIDVLFLGGDFSFKNMVFAALIMVGSIFTVMENKKKLIRDDGDLMRGNPASAFNK
ncbi:DMT family transporter [Mesobacillus sp. LC4]